MKTYGVRAIICHQRDTTDGLIELRSVENDRLIITLWHNHFVIRELTREHSGNQKARANLEVNMVLVRPQTNLTFKRGRQLGQLSQSLTWNKRVYCLLRRIFS